MPREDRIPLADVPVAPLRILLLEDSSADAELLVAMLEEELPGAAVRVATSVAEAVPLLAERLDLVITDLSLPDAEGLESLVAVLAARPDLAVVVLTSRQDHQLALQALSAGAEDYLVKGTQNARGVATAVLYAAQRRQTDEKAHRYERVALSLLDAMEATTCAVDAEGRITAVNRAWRAFAADNDGDDRVCAGVGLDYLETCQSLTGADAAGAAAVAAGLRAVLTGRASRFEHEYPCDSPTERRWFSVRINPLPEAGAVLSHLDVSEAKRAELAIVHAGLHDPLTELPNRHLLTDRLDQALARGRRTGSWVAVAFLDLDQFKHVNDRLGHAAGDALLRQVAQRLGSVVREGDTLSRFSGDEFVVVWPDLEAESSVVELSGRLTGCFEAPFVLGGTSLVVSASVGICVGRAPQTGQELLLAADAAMYDAKHHGRGRTRMYTAELRADAEQRVQVEAELRLALERDELLLHYQPVVDLGRRAVVGVEALVRWQHPDGLRSPDTFVPVAEATGLVVPLGTWVLREACRQTAAWDAEDLRLQVAVNFSTRQIGQPGLVELLAETLAATGLSPHRLLVEVTESTVMEDAERAQVVLAGIEALGVGMAIDDFGTGYSSLVYLKRYPIVALKVDRSFVAGMGISSEDDAIVASVVSLARAVGAVCIAEGVETVEQHVALVALGCDFAQGYLYSRPVPADRLPDALRQVDRVLRDVSEARRRSPGPAPRRVPPPVLRRIAELQAAGGSLHTVAAALNSEHVPNPYGRRWHPTLVAKVVAERSSGKQAGPARAGAGG
ncbi:MAG: domain S-box-containing protein/diguanylate cyclase protein [Frankiales bacterium]|nr:domain S-box-containing protein/diguanylate cyclase protein [Frankiales bacterium]